MNNTYIYDIEIFPNYFGVTFISLNADKKIINVYVTIDKQIIALKVKQNNSESTEEFDEIQNSIDELQHDKQAVLRVLQVKQFVIWKDPNNKNNYKNDLQLLQLFLEKHKVLYGYNSHNYDGIMLDVLLYESKYVKPDGYHTKSGSHITDVLYKHSTSCIDFGTGYYKLLDFKKYYKRLFTNLDIQKILYLDKSFTSLKQVAICLKWYRIQELPLPYNNYIQEKHLFPIMDYNVNDVLITLSLIINQYEEIELRELLSKEFDINASNLSRSSIGKAITTNLYSRFSGIDKKDFENLRTNRNKLRVDKIISDEIRFKTSELKEFLRLIKTQTIYVGTDDDEHKFKHEFMFNGKLYIMALGGLHSKDNPCIFDYTDEFIYRDADVTSYYPNGILKFRICPAHLLENPFRATVGYTKDVRVQAKHDAEILKHNDPIRSKLKLVKSKGLKIAINRMYGAFRDINDYLYDPLCTYKTTINLQLCLIMLIEDLEINKIEVISANTDGIVCKFKPEQESLYKKICNKWEQQTSFELEYTDYEKYFRNDVNNYIAIKKGFKEALNTLYNTNKEVTKEEIKNIEDNYIKRKGLFIEEIEFNKGYNSPIVSHALNQFFLYGIDYHDTIKDHINSFKEAIYDYCISQKTDKKFNIIYTYVEDGIIKQENLQKSNRFYVSQHPTGTIIKQEKSSTKAHKIVAKYGVVPFNDYIYKEDYGLNYGYYFKECSKIIYGERYKKKKTLKKQESGIIKTQSTLFDMEELKIKTSLFDLQESKTKEEQYTNLINRASEQINYSEDKRDLHDIIEILIYIEDYVSYSAFETPDEDLEKLKCCYKALLAIKEDLTNNKESFDEDVNCKIEDLPF